MKILQVAPPWIPVPPEGYGGIEWIVHWLTAGLVERGHEVHLIAAGDSRSPAPTRSVMSSDPERLFEHVLPDVLQGLEAVEAAEELEPDLVHDHTLIGSVGLSGRWSYVTTAHGPTDGWFGRFYERLSRRGHVVAISEAQRASAPRIAWAATIHNAIDVGSFPLSEGDRGFVTWLGRLAPEKGAHLAIEAARRAGVPIVLAGRVSDGPEAAYFEREVRPRLGDDASFVGEVDEEAKRQLLLDARALLFPVDWEEPFGLVMAEAMACGTPVIAFPRGAAREVVEHGRTGFLVTDVEGMARAIGAIGELRPEDCRASAATRFDVSMMVDAYESLYRRIAAEPRRRGLGVRGRG
ncbi:MAG TPA: glycosyltransferase family 4 protein [Actinomycetota bacterium]|nr:glycosyltransferase family 4 protein [Actinomycetota bacterium]